MEEISIQICKITKYISEIYTLLLNGFLRWVVRGVSRLYMLRIEVNICAEVVAVVAVVEFVDVVSNVVENNDAVFDVVDDISVVVAPVYVAVDYISLH